MHKLAGLSFALALVAGCGDSGNKDPDGGVKVDGGTQDMTSEAPPDLAAAAVGTQIVAGASTLNGLNDDDSVFVYTAKGTQLVPLAGGTPTIIDAKGRVAFVHDKVIFSLGSIIQSPQSGTMSSWSAAGGLKTLSAKSALVDPAADKTGTRVIYATNISTDGKTTAVAVNAVTGGDEKIALPQIVAPTITADGSTDPCSPLLLGGGTKFVVTFCNMAAGDGGVTPSTMVTVDPTTGAFATIPTTLKTTAEFNIDDARTKVLVIDVDDKATVYSLDNLAATTVNAGAPIKFASITPDGTAVVYVTTQGAANRLTLAGGAVTPLTTGIDSVRQLTDDFAHLFYSTKTATAVDSQPIGDILLVSTTAAGTPITFDSAAEATFFGPGFTTDGSKVAYYTNIDANSSGTLKLAPAAGGNATTVASAVWSHQAAAGAKLTYLDAFDKTNSRGDLHVVDAASGAISLVATAVEERYFLTKAKDKIVYSSQKVKGIAGVYVTPAQ